MINYITGEFSTSFHTNAPNQSFGKDYYIYILHSHSNMFIDMQVCMFLNTLSTLCMYGLELEYITL